VVPPLNRALKGRVWMVCGAVKALGSNPVEA
jgi:hypothetical protein